MFTSDCARFRHANTNWNEAEWHGLEAYCKTYCDDCEPPLKSLGQLYCEDMQRRRRRKPCIPPKLPVIRPCPEPLCVMQIKRSPCPKQKERWLSEDRICLEMEECLPESMEGELRRKEERKKEILEIHRKNRKKQSKKPWTEDYMPPKQVRCLIIATAAFKLLFLVQKRF